MRHKILINNQETGMFMKDFLRYIRLSSVSDLYTLEKKRLLLNPGITSAEMFPNADVNQYIAEIHKVRKHAAIAFKCWFR